MADNQLDLLLNADGLAPKDALAKIADDASDCTSCRHHRSRKQIVFGDGPIDAKIILLGEAPGRNEDKTGLPFTGKSGDLLMKILARVNLKRTDLYICNVLKCRPKDNEEPGMTALKACRRYLTQQLMIVHPKVIIAAGNWALKGLFLESFAGIMKEQGVERDYNGIIVLPSLHPAFLLRSEGSPNEKEYKDKTLAIWKRAVEIAYPEKVKWNV